MCGTAEAFSQRRRRDLCGAVSGKQVEEPEFCFNTEEPEQLNIMLRLSRPGRRQATRLYVKNTVGTKGFGTKWAKQVSN